MQAAPTYFLKSARLGFRRWSPQDLLLAMALWADPEVTRLIGGPFSEEQIRHRLNQEIAFMRDQGVQYWPVFLLAGDDFAGCCGLRPYGTEARIRELGFHFRPTEWGKGLAGEAAGAVIQYAKESLHLQGLFAGHHPENLASRRVLQRLGFRFTHEELYPPTGKMHSCYFMEISK